MKQQIKIDDEEPTVVINLTLDSLCKQGCHSLSYNKADDSVVCDRCGRRWLSPTW